MAHYDLTHLTQPEDQAVMGPIQDDEALFLYSVIRGMRLERILEIGGGRGYSAFNFIRAVNKKGIVYTVDVIDVPKLADNHIVFLKSASELKAEDFNNESLHLVFFDCHEYEPSVTCFTSLVSSGIITDKTVLALHDTNLYPRHGRPTEEGFIHQTVERTLVNYFSDLGYNIFNLHTEASVHNNNFPYRHGVSLAQKFHKLRVENFE
jgi:predicted O-methyltransferase YrrM